MNNFSHCIIVLGLLFVAGCTASDRSTPQSPTVKPTGFDAFDAKAKAWTGRVSAGIRVTGERIAANDLAGAKVANEATEALVPPAPAEDLEWFRKLAAPDADAAEIVRKTAENARLLEEVRALKFKVAQGVSPEEAQRLADESADRAAARESRKWRDRGIYALAVAMAVAAVAAAAAAIYLRGKLLGIIAAVSGGGAAVLFWLPDFLESPAFKRFETALAWALGIGSVALIAAFVIEAVRWVRSAKADRVATVAARAVKAAL